MKLRKFLSAALCAALLACLLPAAAYADGVKSITAKEQDETAAAEDISALALDEAVVNPAPGRRFITTATSYSTTTARSTTTAA